jgi:hypothetical protein
MASVEGESGRGTMNDQRRRGEDEGAGRCPSGEREQEPRLIPAVGAGQVNPNDTPPRGLDPLVHFTTFTHLFLFVTVIVDIRNHG